MRCELADYERAAIWRISRKSGLPASAVCGDGIALDQMIGRASR